MTDKTEPSVFRSDRTGLRSVLGDLEADVMNVIWGHSHDKGLTVRDVHEVIQRDRPIAYTTVMTTMVRLAKKKLLRAKKLNPAHIYFPAMSQAEFTSIFVGRILDRLLESYSSAAVSHFAELAGPESRESVLKLLLDIVQQRKAKEVNSTRR